MRQYSWSKGVPPHMRLSVRRSGSKDSPERGCVGAERSGGVAVGGARCSVTGTTGWPVRRSSTNSSPCLVGCTSAGMVAPPTRKSTSVGCDGTS